MMKMKCTWIVALGWMGACGSLSLQAQDSPNDPYQAVVKREFGTAQREMTAIEKEVASAKPDQFPQLEAKLTAILESSEATMPGKQFACQMLRTVASPKCIPAVSKLLTDEKLSHMARYVLAPLADPAADEALRQGLEKTQGNLRLGIVNTLGDRGSRSSVSALAGLLTQDDATAAASLNALGKIGGAAAADALDQAKVVDSLKAAWGHAYLRVAESLAADDAARAGKMLRALFDGPYPSPIRAGALNAIARAQREQAVPLLVANLSSQDSLVRRAALHAVVTVPGNAATKALANEMAGLASEAKITMLGALAARGDAEGLSETVNKLASDADPDLRAAALKALGRLGDAGSVAILAQAVKEGGTLRSEAARALGELQGGGVVDALISQASSGEPAVRESMMNVLAERRQAEALPLFRKALDDDEARIRRAALKALVTMGAQADLARLAEMLPGRKDEAERDQFAQAMAELGRRIPDKAARTEPVLAAFSKADAQGKACLLTVLAALGGDSSLQAVRSCLSGEAALKKAAVRALSDWSDASPMPDLLSVAKEDQDASVQILALRGYIRMAGLQGTPTDKKVEYYKTAMELARRSDEKRLVLAGLAEAARVPALKMVEACLEDESLKREAWVAYEKIAESLVGRNPDAAKEALQRVADKAPDEDLRKKAQKALDKLK